MAFKSKKAGKGWQDMAGKIRRTRKRDLLAWRVSVMGRPKEHGVWISVDGKCQAMANIIV